MLALEYGTCFGDRRLREAYEIFLSGRGRRDDGFLGQPLPFFGPPSPDLGREVGELSWGQF